MSFAILCIEVSLGSPKNRTGSQGRVLNSGLVIGYIFSAVQRSTAHMVKWVSVILCTEGSCVLACPVYLWFPEGSGAIDVCVFLLFLF